MMQAVRTRKGVLIGSLIAALTAGALPVLAAGTATAAEGCEVEYTVANSWDGGFQANVSITADEPIDGWELTWQFPAGTTVSNAWNVDWSQSGSTFTGSDVGWNGSIGTGQSAQFGFIGSGATAVPSGFAVNGDLCNGQAPTPTPDPTTDPTDDPTPTPTPEPSDTSDPSEPIRIMPLGDSITGSPGCWRGLLWDQLDQAGYDVDFVGSLSQACAPTGSDADHEGHGGYLVTQSVDNGNVRMWLEQNTPDVLLLHFGTNDVWSNLPPAQILEAYTQIIADLRELNPDATILVAQIIPLVPDASFGCTDCPQRAINLNAEIPGWAAAHTTTQSPIIVVDQWTGFDPLTDTYDGVHPDAEGNIKIADRWFDTLTTHLP